MPYPNTVPWINHIIPVFCSQSASQFIPKVSNEVPATRTLNVRMISTQHASCKTLTHKNKTTNITHCLSVCRHINVVFCYLVIVWFIYQLLTLRARLQNVQWCSTVFSLVRSLMWWTRVLRIVKPWKITTQTAIFYLDVSYNRKSVWAVYMVTSPFWTIISILESLST